MDVPCQCHTVPTTTVQEESHTVCRGGRDGHECLAWPGWPIDSPTPPQQRAGPAQALLTAALLTAILLAPPPNNPTQTPPPARPASSLSTGDPPRPHISLPRRPTRLSQPCFARPHLRFPPAFSARAHNSSHNSSPVHPPPAVPVSLPSALVPGAAANGLESHSETPAAAPIRSQHTPAQRTAPEFTPFGEESR